jgi:malate synthase
VKWDQHNPEGRGTARVSDGWMAQFLRREAEQQAQMLVQVRERVERDLAAKPNGVPSKETMRAAKFAQEGFKILATLELEHAKVELLARRVLGKAPMSDEEYMAKLEALGDDSLDTQPIEKLEAAIARRRALAASSEP